MTEFKEALEGMTIGKENGLVTIYGADIDAIIHALRTALQRNDVPQWQPIETAPKPSGRILLTSIHDRMKRVHYGHWYVTGNEWVYDGFSFGNFDDQPTHWMPLPEAPKAGE